MSREDSPHGPHCERCALIALYAEYNRAIDSGDAQRWAQTFTQDGVFEHPSATFAGQQELERFIRERNGKLAGHPCSHQRHWNHAIDVQIDALRATGRCDLLVSGVRIETKRTEVVATGRYVDELKRGKDGWRFCRRRLVVD